MLGRTATTLSTLMRRSSSTALSVRMATGLCSVYIGDVSCVD